MERVAQVWAMICARLAAAGIEQTCGVWWRNGDGDPTDDHAAVRWCCILGAMRLARRREWITPQDLYLVHAAITATLERHGWPDGIAAANDAGVTFALVQAWLDEDRLRCVAS